MAQSGFKKALKIQLNGKLIDLSRPQVMGILNVTPDSFFDGGKYLNKNLALEKLSQMTNDGAAFIDIGAVSSRPGAKIPSQNEELKRLIPIIELIKEKFPEVKLSIDTFRSDVVKQLCNSFGGFIVNDISAGDFDNKMFETIANLNLPYCMMHIKGKPENMQTNPIYENVTNDVIKYFSSKIEKLKLIGINNLIVDPGFGFGKTLNHNYELLSKLDYFKILELPIMAGISRKSMVFNLLETNASKALNGTTVLNTLALERGANILRVHDVREAIECISLVEKLKTVI